MRVGPMRAEERTYAGPTSPLTLPCTSSGKRARHDAVGRNDAADAGCRCAHDVCTGFNRAHLRDLRVLIWTR